MTNELEKEIIIYAKIGDPSGFRMADATEEHFQVENLLANGSKLRARKTTKSGVDQYKLTLKQKVKGPTSAIAENNEFSMDITPEFFAAFREASSKFIRKTRFIFNSKSVKVKLTGHNRTTEVELPSVIYEVDVFHVDHKNKCLWCKIEVEVQNLDAFIRQNYPDLIDVTTSIKVSHLPFKPEDGFVMSDDATEEQVALVDELWNDYFSHDLVTDHDSHDKVFQHTW